MKYPHYLENKKKEITNIVTSWPIEKRVEEVMTWLLQFDSTDYDIAIRILRQMNVIGPEELNASLAISYSKLLRHANEKGIKINKENTIYVPFGSAGKSGAMIAYNFRMINGLNSAYFLSKETINLIKDGRIDNLVMIDDIIASGDQSSSQVKEIAEKALGLGISNIFVITAFGFKDGLRKVGETEIVDVFSAIEYDVEDTIASLDASFYEGLQYDVRQSYLNNLSKKYKGIGYKGIGALITFYYNTPNCTLHAVWCNNDGWIPLFPRRHDLNNKSIELYEFEELLKEKNSKNEIQKNDFSIYVEGKSEELFISELAKRHNNFGAKQLKVISIGPFYQKTLVDELSKYSNKILFITDDEKEDENNPHYKGLIKVLEGKTLLQIGPIMSYFDMKKVATEPVFSKMLDYDIFDDSVSPEFRYAQLENKLLKRTASNFRFSNMRELIENVLTKKKSQCWYKIL